MQFSLTLECTYSIKYWHHARIVLCGTSIYQHFPHNNFSSYKVVLNFKYLTIMQYNQRHPMPCNKCPLLQTYHTTTVLRPFFRDHTGQPVPEKNFRALWCKGRLTEADTPTIWLGATPSRLSSAHLHHPFLQAGCPSCRPTNSVKHWR